MIFLRLTGAAALALLLMTASHAASAAYTFQGKLWILPLSQVENATFPIPSATPDATFVVHHLSFFSDAPGPGGTAPESDPKVNNTVSKLLNSADPVSSLVFSGLTNAATGTVISGTTQINDSVAGSCGTYGPYIELTGKVGLTHNQLVTVSHDDGISITVDGVAVSGLTSGTTPAISENFQFTGTTGLHTIDIVWTNNCAQSLLSFTPAM